MANFLKSLFVKGVEIDPAGAASDQVLKYNGTKFVPGTASTVGSIDDLSDVAITSPASNQILKYNGTLWTNASASSGNVVSDSPPSSPTAGQVWFESDTGKTFIYYDSYWVEISGGRGDTNPVGAVTAFAGSVAPTSWLLCAGQDVSRTVYAPLFAVIGTTYGAGDGTTTFTVPDMRGRAVAGLDNMGGTDAGRLSVANTLGTTAGAETVTLTSAQSGVPAHSHPNTASFSGSFTGTAASHGHVQDAHNHGISVARAQANAYLDTGNRWAGGTSLNNEGYGYAGSNADVTMYESYIASNTATNQNTSITPAGSVSGSVTMSNANNTAANAASAHSVMQPTIVLNYIIKAL